MGPSRGDKAAGAQAGSLCHPDRRSGKSSGGPCHLPPPPATSPGWGPIRSKRGERGFLGEGGEYPGPRGWGGVQCIYKTPPPPLKVHGVLLVTGVGGTPGWGGREWSWTIPSSRRWEITRSPPPPPQLLAPRGEKKKRKSIPQFLKRPPHPPSLPTLGAGGAHGGEGPPGRAGCCWGAGISGGAAKWPDPGWSSSRTGEGMEGMGGGGTARAFAAQGGFSQGILSPAWLNRC